MVTNNLQVIVGLGATGSSCLHYLTQLGLPVAVTDTRLDPPDINRLRKNFPQITFALGGLDPDLLARASRIILSPGIALYEPAIAAQVARGTPVIGDIELFAQATTMPVIAITGTNAKSTVTTLVGLMATAAGYNAEMGGNLGIPALDLLMNNPTANLFVLELSSFQLETTFTLKPKVATVLNISPDHMDRYPDLAAYQAAKFRIYQDCKVAVCNRDDSATEYVGDSEKLYFTLQEPNKNEFGLRTEKAEIYLAFEDKLLMPIRELPVKGKHYQANALAALAIGHGFGLPFEPMLTVLRDFKGLPHRCQLIAEYHQVQWYNDSKGTNVGATQAAIEGLGSEIQGKLILIAGGVGKNADFHPLLPTIEKYVRHVVLIGEAAEELSLVFGNKISWSFAPTMAEAVNQAAQFAQPKDSVLLSPACASFDMFKNFAHRGEVFSKLVTELTI